MPSMQLRSFGLFGLQQTNDPCVLAAFDLMNKGSEKRRGLMSVLLNNVKMIIATKESATSTSHSFGTNCQMSSRQETRD